jgi:integrase
MGKPKSRGNKQGSVYYRKDRKCWVAQITIGWRPSSKEEGRPIPIKKKAEGFKSKKEALNALDKLLNGENPVINKLSLEEVFQKWKTYYSPRVSEKTMKDNYESAYKHFSSLKHRRIDTISSAELQDCMDQCPAGKRTHQLMKVTAGLIWAYALDMNIVRKDITDNLYIGKHESVPREPLTSNEIQLVKDQIDKELYASYIVCQCYLGYRPGEFLEIKKDQVKKTVINNEDVYYIVEGIKTNAGKNRRVIVPKQILTFIKYQLSLEGTEYLFPMYCYRIHTTEFIGFKKMSTKYYNESVFKPLMNKLGIQNRVPYSARHSYSDKLKHAAGDERDKAALMGHSDYSFTRSQYQSSSLEDLKVVVDSIE